MQSAASALEVVQGLQGQRRAKKRDARLACILGHGPERQPIGSLDIAIGAHALSLGATLATNNTREFSRIKGLTVVDWLLQIQ